MLEDVERGRAKAWIPAVVGAEVVLLHQLGRTKIGLPALQQILEENAGFGFLPLDLPQLQQFSALLGVRDAFDRFIIAAARHLDAKLISNDQAIAASGLVGVVWE